MFHYAPIATRRIPPFIKPADLAGTRVPLWYSAFELAELGAVILCLDSQTPLPRRARKHLRKSPRFEDTTDLKPEIIMRPTGFVALYYKPAPTSRFP